MAKITMIELTANGRRESFGLEHAHQLLLMRNNGGWKLPEDSEWSWSAEKGFEKKGKKESQPKAAASTEALHWVLS